MVVVDQFPLLRVLVDLVHDLGVEESAEVEAEILFGHFLLVFLVQF